MKPGWCQRQMENTRRNVDEWPSWMRKAAGISGPGKIERLETEITTLRRALGEITQNRDHWLIENNKNLTALLCASRERDEWQQRWARENRNLERVSQAKFGRALMKITAELIVTTVGFGSFKAETEDGMGIRKIAVEAHVSPDVADTLRPGQWITLTLEDLTRDGARPSGRRRPKQ